MKEHHPHHGHRHHHLQDFGRMFAIGVTLNIAFVLIEAICGILADSLALLSDAGHNFSDVVGLIVAWGANRLSEWKPTRKHTYGYRRSSILAALLNAFLLLVAIGAITWEAIRRFQHPVPIHANTIIWVAAIGIVVNTATALLFWKGRKKDLNIRGAFLHMAADAAISAGVVVAGFLIATTGIQMIDPVVSIIIAAIIFIGTWKLLLESLNLALDAVPENIDAEAVARYLSGIPNVVNVHHLHIWGLSSADTALTAHLVLSRPDTNNALLSQICAELRNRFGIDHATIQFESSDNATCPTNHCNLHLRRDGTNETKA